MSGGDYVRGDNVRFPIDHNPTLKITKKENDTGMKVNIELYLKLDLLRTGVGL